MYLEDLSVWRRIITLPLLFYLTILGLIQEITDLLDIPFESSFTDEDVSSYFRENQAIIVSLFVVDSVMVSSLRIILAR
ncbi:unnamed protein product [Brassica rapa subsp. trilocularis]